jgi:hypothetical protein
MESSDKNENVIQGLETFLHSLKEYRALRDHFANRDATQKQKEYIWDLRNDLLKNVGRFKPLITELTEKEKVTITKYGKEFNQDMWLRGLALKWGKITSEVLDYCIDVTTQAMGKLEDDIRNGYRNNQGIVQQSNTRDQSAEEILEKLLNRFHLVAKELKNRYDSRIPIDIKDEYDVQYLMHALLRIYFDDIRPEEWTPSYAGGSSRMDFLLKNERMVVEIKKTRDKLLDKDIGEQLIVDITKYKAHPDCKTLFCFVYDPDDFISNAIGLENDLNKLSNDKLKVCVYLSPK